MIKDKIIDDLKEQNKQLKQKLNKLTVDKNMKSEALMQQSKMASMGEMINNIAHQWRQPLMEISSLMINLEASIKFTGKTTNNQVLEATKETTEIVKFMSQTIDDFRNFFATDKKKEEFIIANQISLVLSILKQTLVNHNIKLNFYIKNNAKAYGFKNEYAQVVINIIANAIDVLISRKIKNPTITLTVYSKNHNVILEIEDNASGIDIEPIEKIFEPFFTQNKKNGTGIGLFMSKLIIENNMNGTLELKNKKYGACFKIVL
jgi:signal transduction histidine kinase